MNTLKFININLILCHAYHTAHLVTRQAVGWTFFFTETERWDIWWGGLQFTLLEAPQVPSRLTKWKQYKLRFLFSVFVQAGFAYSDAGIEESSDIPIISIPILWPICA